MEKLADIGEDALIERLTANLSFGPGVVVGPGDDCAVLTSNDEGIFSLLKTDCVVEGVHFKIGTDPEAVGWKALCRALSDIAAMGGTPENALVTIVSSADRGVAEVEGWYRGIRRAAETFRVDLVGGEMASLPENAASAVISVTLTGRVEKDRCAFRSGARIGDRIAVTGKLGRSLATGRHLDFHPRIGPGRWLANGERGLTAMMDISDGLARDLPRLARASGVGYRVDFDSIPRNENGSLDEALTDGEDYELLVTVAADAADATAESWRAEFPDLPLTFVGVITETTETPLEGGWDHFSKP